jgi:hypothetical protein
MDTSIIIMGLVMAALFIVPVIFFIRSGKKNKDNSKPTN